MITTIKRLQTISIKDLRRLDYKIINQIQNAKKLEGQQIINKFGFGFYEHKT